MKNWKRVRARTRRRTLRNRKKVRGAPDRPRLCVFRSNRYIYGQLIDDIAGCTLATSSSLVLSRAGKLKAGATGNREGAKQVGLDLAAKAGDLGIKEVRLDRGPYKYHGRVQALAEGAREGGLVF